MRNHKPEKITSPKNPRVQWIRALLSDRTVRKAENLFITEGVRLSEEVLNAGIVPNSIFFTEENTSRGKDLIQRSLEAGAQGFEVSSEVMKKISDTETAQGIIMVVPQTAIPIPEKCNLVLILDQLRDPGNCGTILRTAAAAGVQLVFNAPGSADLFMPKVVRAGMGAHFRMCIRQADWSEIQQYCKPRSGPHLNMFLAESGDGMNMWQANLRDPLALIIGGEAEGASIEARNTADHFIHIPMPGQFESLNAGVAASILLFEIIRQRTQ